MTIVVTVALVRAGKLLASQIVRATAPEEVDCVVDMAELCARSAAVKGWAPVAAAINQETQANG